MKTLIVTGGTGGLGSVVVPRLEREYRCVLLGRGEAVSQEAYGLVHMAGGWEGGAVSETTDDAWGRMIELNLNLSFRMVRDAVKRLERPGRIVAISSIASQTNGKDSAAYAIAKKGLNALIEATAAEVAGSGLTANALLPATLDARLREAVADAILFLLSDAAASVNGALIPVTA